jgi:hypothetical protein
MEVALLYSKGMGCPSQYARFVLEKPDPPNASLGPTGTDPPKMNAPGVWSEGIALPAPAAGVTMNRALADVPPPGGGLTTATSATEGCASSDAARMSSR